jgi:hypothetical protein
MHLLAACLTPSAFRNDASRTHVRHANILASFRAPPAQSVRLISVKWMYSW